MKFNGTDQSLASPCLSSTSKSSATKGSRSHQASTSFNHTVRGSKFEPRGLPIREMQNYHHKTRYDTRFSMASSMSWKHLPQIEVKLVQVPAKFTTWDIYRLLDGFGNVIKIQILDKERHVEKTAYVTFRPTPDIAFWELDGALGNIVATLNLQNSNIATIQDPFNKGVRIPDLLQHDAQSIEIGYMVSENQIMSMFTSMEQNVYFLMNLNKKTISVDFCISAPGKSGRHDLGNFRLQLRLDRILAVYFEPVGSHEVMTITVDFPPRLYRRSTDINVTHQNDSRLWSEWDAMIRQTGVILPETVTRLHPAGIRNDEAIVDVGRWRVYRLNFKSFENAHCPLARIKQALSSFNVQVIQKHFDILPRHTSTILDLVDHNGSKNAQDNVGYLSELQASMTRRYFNLSFETRYQLEVCLSHGWLHETNFTEDFVAKLHALDRNEQHKAVGALERVAELKRRFYNPMEIFQLPVHFTAIAATRNLPRHCTVARSAVVTPSMIYFRTPSVEVSNRITREWSVYSNRFLRVRFSDELDHGHIMSHDKRMNDEIYDRITQILRHGIVLGDRVYRFLAFGNSQFRERGAFFFAPTDEVSCDVIRSRLGKMSDRDQYQPAKVCARIGQNFSTTRGLAMKITIRTHKLDHRNELLLPDIKRNGYIFTDGVGKISKFLAQMIACEFGLSTDDVPSVFQFRLGGCKGILAVDPALSGNEVHLRPSQYKFAAVHDGLEIIRASRFVSASLNRQIIIVLSALGVSDSVFVRKMKSQLQVLDAAMVDENVAINELERVVDMNQTTLKLAAMARAGFIAAREPFMMSMLRLWRSWCLKILKEKARIFIENGAFLFGTVDETATLRGHFNSAQRDMAEHNICDLPEIFCYIDRRRKGIYEPVRGVCIVARNPSLHPGDIRVVHAVDVPQLHHIKNAIVFPQSGDRDISSMCSGGDLDGDDYLLIWDPELIPREWNHPPMDFTPAKPLSLSHKVTVDDITDFFVDYVKSDNLAFIATRHLALADYLDEGVKNEKCKHLAQLHSLAVDYPKSGVPVSIPSYLTRGIKWPHFMEKPRTDYKSRKILGQLYDLVVREDFTPEFSSVFDKRVIEAFDVDEKLIKRAELIKCRYDSQLRKIMAQHDIATEFEVWSAFVMEHNNGKKDYTFAEELGILMEAIRIGFREECEKEAGGKNPACLYPFVAAMYIATARQAQQYTLKSSSEGIGDDSKNAVKPLHSKDIPFISFPWLFLPELSKIAQGQIETEDRSGRLQCESKNCHREHVVSEDEERAIVKLGSGSILLSEFQACSLDDKETSTASRNDTSEETNRHIETINKNIFGRIPDEHQRRRNARIESLKTHVTSSTTVMTTKKNSENATVPDLETDFTVTDNVILPHEPYQDLLISPRQNSPLNSVRSEADPMISPDVGLQIKDGSMTNSVQVHLDLNDSDSEDEQS
ncbi:uncharacterized protein PV09_01446 [Verruconis gallopava]|uniref:RNA-dependent RNA polymerase n=1 Tax=Verruconis gallopava TaxID=253628 RepID=A0A0D2B8E9_9PEZI|nr:uncharacterized protein PV09_01446 [Verruconis gallopava]KIW07479.1 hypothetical protein PV09_01446 [Verruconis gallopava]